MFKVSALNIDTFLELLITHQYPVKKKRKLSTYFCTTLYIYQPSFICNLWFVPWVMVDSLPNSPPTSEKSVGRMVHFPMRFALLSAFLFARSTPAWMAFFTASSLQASLTVRLLLPADVHQSRAAFVKASFGKVVSGSTSHCKQTRP